MLTTLDGPAVINAKARYWSKIATFWISLSLNFGLSPEFRLTNHRGVLHNVVADVIADISVVLCLFVNKRKVK